MCPACYACKVIDQVTACLSRMHGGRTLRAGYSLMQGYYKKPEETAAVIDAEGWLHTGDCVDHAGGRDDPLLRRYKTPQGGRLKTSTLLK